MTLKQVHVALGKVGLVDVVDGRQGPQDSVAVLDRRNDERSAALFCPAFPGFGRSRADRARLWETEPGWRSRKTQPLNPCYNSSNPTSSMWSAPGPPRTKWVTRCP